MSYAIPMTNVSRSSTSSSTSTTAASFGSASSAAAGTTLPGGMRILTDATNKYALEHDVMIKAIIVGDSGTGKTALLWQFTEKQFSPHFISTIGCDYKSITLDRQGKIVKASFWDVAGQERFRTITRTFYRSAHACAVVFAVDDAESFEHVREWAKEATQHSGHDMPFLLVGNKSDVPAAQRQVPREAAEQLARQMDCEYVETSAKTADNVGAAFARLVDISIERKLRLNADPSQRGNNALGGTGKRIQLGDGATHPSGGAAGGKKGFTCACG